MIVTETEDKLDALLQGSYKQPTDLLPNELTLLISSFSPSHPTSHRSKAYLVLSAVCQGVRGPPSHKENQETDSATESLVRVFMPVITTRFSNPTDVDQLIALSFLTALFQVDWASASSIFVQDGLADSVMDSLDIAPNCKELSLQVAHLLGQASGHKSCRRVVSSHSLAWLKTKSLQTQDTALRAACAIALVKLLKGDPPDNADSEAKNDEVAPAIAIDKDLAILMKGLIIERRDDSALADAVEGLAYLSVVPAIKELLAKDNVFLTRLFSLLPSRKAIDGKDINPTLIFGIVNIAANLCSYPPRLSEEEARIQKLGRMTAARQRPRQAVVDELIDPLEVDDYVKERGRKLIAAGALDALTSALRLTESKRTRVTVGDALLSLIENKQNRGKVLQSGGAKALIYIIKHSSSPMSDESAKLEDAGLRAIQALAKLAITASPFQVFGPDKGATYDAIRPFSVMLLHSSATLLQQFESIMALTNVSSIPGSSERIAEVKMLLNKVEILLLEDHTLVRRASMELICNLIAGSDKVYERWTTESKLHILVAMSDVDDLPTRLAASGALAVVSTGPSACAALLRLHQESGRVLPILVQLIDPSASDEDPQPGRHAGLAHRGVICARNFLLSVEGEEARLFLVEDAKKAGLVEALSSVMKEKFDDAEVLRATAELLRYVGLPAKA